MKIAESHVEEATLAWVSELGYAILHGPDIAPDGTNPQRTSYDEVILPARLSAAVARLNPNIPAEVQAEAIRRVYLAEYPSLATENRRLHRFLVEGVPVEFYGDDGVIKGDRGAPDRFHAIPTPMTGSRSISSPSSSKRPTGGPTSCCSSTACPLVVIELKNAGDENATLDGAFNQLADLQGANLCLSSAAMSRW